MSISDTIAPALPYLRRFARALTGTQAGGDAYVVATLEAVVDGGGVLDPEFDPRAALYRVFLQVWMSVKVNRESPALAPSAAVGAADRNLEAMTPLPRVAFLLHTMEGFSLDQIAAILETDTAEVQKLLDRAGAEIAAMISTGVLIIEDEPMIAMDLEALVRDLGHTVLHIARTRSEAVAASARHSPGLVMADIKLADGSSGLDAVADILADHDVPVIFITAYPERLLTGQRPEPAFLITKPFRPETVKAVISQALFFDQKSTLPEHRRATV